MVHRLCAVKIGNQPFEHDDTMQRVMAKKLRALLVERPELANYKDTSSADRAAGCYPLHTAAQYSNIHALKELIAGGAQLNTRKNNGVTPLFGTLSSRPFMQTVANTVAPPAHNIFTFSHRASRIRSSHPRPRASTPMPTHDQHPGLPFPSSSLLDSAVFSFVLSSKTF